MITFQGVLIGTGILWALNAIFVVPLTNYLIRKKLRSPAYVHLGGEAKTIEDRSVLKTMATLYYVLVDTAVLGTAGFFFGLLLGWFFVGISLKGKGWPGMIAFIVMSIIGCSLRR